jgi:hypothetical protein
LPKQNNKKRATFSIKPKTLTKTSQKINMPNWVLDKRKAHPLSILQKFGYGNKKNVLA